MLAFHCIALGQLGVKDRYCRRLASEWSSSIHPRDAVDRALLLFSVFSSYTPQFHNRIVRPKLCLD